MDQYTKALDSAPSLLLLGSVSDTKKVNQKNDLQYQSVVHDTPGNDEKPSLDEYLFQQTVDAFGKSEKITDNLDELEDILTSTQPWFNALKPDQRQLITGVLTN